MVRRGARSWNLIDKWKNLKLRLEHELGPAKIDGATDDEVQRLVFHPQEHRSSPARILKHSRVQRREQLKVQQMALLEELAMTGRAAIS